MSNKMFKRKKVTVNQNYEKYWKITLEYSDIHGERFIGTLRLIVNFIDCEDMSSYNEKKFEELQKIINDTYPKADMGSIRKSINQFVKLGFINFELKSYHESTKEFLEAKTKRKRRSIFSKIVYSNSSLDRSVTNSSDKKEINFLLKTLEEVGQLHKKDIVGLMNVDIAKTPKGYLTKEEVEMVSKRAEKISFIKRKYNQVGYLWNVLNKLDDVVIINDNLCFEDDVQVMFAEELKAKARLRDGYLHRIFKNQLKNEAEEKLGDIKCMLEKLSYPSLVASHIKPFIFSNDYEAYDPNNGILLSRNMDALFDRGYISFKKDGSVIFSKRLTKGVAGHVKGYKLEKIFINDKRLKYLDYHRKKVFN